MAKEEQKAKKEEQQTQEEKKSKSMISLPMIIGFVVFLIIYTVLLYFLFGPRKFKIPEEEKKKKEVAANTPVIGPTVEIEPLAIRIMINPVKNQGTILSIGVAIECDSEKTKKIVEDLKPWIKSLLIDIVSEKTYEELLKAEARTSIRLQLEALINKRLKAHLKKGQVYSVMITEYTFAG